MTNKNIFDMLENAEDDHMKVLTENCPDINGEKFERLLARTEKVYSEKKYNIDNDIDESAGNTVSGVDRAERASWIMPFTIAASIVLVAGITIGNIAMLNRNSKNTADGSEKQIAEDTSPVQVTTYEQPTYNDQDVFTNKDALIALCQNASSHYDKVEVTYREERSEDVMVGKEKRKVSGADNCKAEFDKNEKSLMFYNQWDNTNADDEFFSSSNIDFFYKDKRICLFPNNSYEVLAINDSWESQVDYLVHFLDPRAEILPYYNSLEAKDKWYIVGKDTVCGRSCVAINYDSSIDEWIDAETGVILKYSKNSSYKDKTGETIEEKVIFEVTDIKFDEDAQVKTPLELRQMIEGGGYEPTLSYVYDENGNKADPYVINDLDFLGIPAEPFTQASSEASPENKSE